MNDFFVFYEENTNQDPEFLNQKIHEFCSSLETAIFYLEGKKISVDNKRITFNGQT